MKTVSWLVWSPNEILKMREIDYGIVNVLGLVRCDPCLGIKGLDTIDSARLKTQSLNVLRLCEQPLILHMFYVQISS